jgi:hypothetical protein
MEVPGLLVALTVVLLVLSNIREPLMWLITMCHQSLRSYVVRVNG